MKSKTFSKEDLQKLIDRIMRKHGITSESDVARGAGYLNPNYLTEVKSRGNISYKTIKKLEDKWGVFLIERPGRSNEMNEEVVQYKSARSAKIENGLQFLAENIAIIMVENRQNRKLLATLLSLQTGEKLSVILKEMKKDGDQEISALKNELLREMNK